MSNISAMSHLFIIWTMQRTGGTALADLLMEMSEHKKAEHEPFNRDRQFGAITAAWSASRDEAGLTRALEAVFAQGYLIKHTYELRDQALNTAIMRAAAAAGYRHILLLRRDEFSRLVSKFVAEASGTWFKDYADAVYAKIRAGERTLAAIPVDKIVTAYRHCRDMTEQVRSSFRSLGLDFHEIDYEDLYFGEGMARIARLKQLLGIIGFAPAVVEAHRPSIEAKILTEGQDTRSIMPFIPNLSEVIVALTAAGCEPPSELLSDLGSALPEPLLARTTADPAAAGELRAGGWNIGLVWQFQRLAEKYGAASPFLEIGSNLIGPAILSGDYFAESERHGIGLDGMNNANGITIYRENFFHVSQKFKDGYFRTVFSNAALEHDVEFWRTLKEIKRLLGPGGFLMIAVPGFREPKSTTEVRVIGPRNNPLRQATPTFRIHGPSDYWRFSPRALREVILKGFDIKEVRPLGPLNWMIGVGAKATL